MSGDGIRLDVWLYRARFFKTRSLSAKHISKGRIRIERNGQIFRVKKPHTATYVGDLLTLTTSDKIVQIEILSLGEIRGPAKQARTLYNECLLDMDTFSRFGG